MKTQTAFFTGQRKLSQECIPEIKRRLIAQMEMLIARGVIYYGCGGAVGFDTLAGFTTLELKEKHPKIRLIMVLPCRNQDIRWTDIDRQRYKTLLVGADKTVCVSDAYTKVCMSDRNRFLVSHSAHCIAYQTMKSGGTAFMVSLAKKQGLSMANLADLL